MSDINTKGIHVSPAEMEADGKSTLDLSNELNNEIKELTATKDSLTSMWKGDASDTFNDAATSELKSLTEFQELITEMGNRIISGANTFYNNEEENVDDAKKLLKDFE